jgi:hypothetical protein
MSKWSSPHFLFSAAYRADQAGHAGEDAGALAGWRVAYGDVGDEDGCGADAKDAAGSDERGDDEKWHWIPMSWYLWSG